MTNDNEVCVSWNVGSHTRKSFRQHKVRWVNSEMRRWKLKPSPYEDDSVSDTLEFHGRHGFRVANRLRSIVSREG